MKITPTFYLRTFAMAFLAMTAQAGSAQSFSTCTGQTVLSINGATTATTQNATAFPVNIRITARGGDGGHETACCGLSGGSAATMMADFVLASGETLRAISGSAGGTNTSGGGGAGSGAVNCGNPSDCANGTILIIAAGGGGAHGGGLMGIGGSAGTGSGGGGLNNGNAGGGGGANANGMPYPSGNYGGIVLKTGVSGGVGNGGRGMGSGGGRTGGGGAGGGGGHTGGAAGAGASAFSFSSGINQVNTDGVSGASSLANGSVDVVCLSFALPVELVDFKATVGKAEVALQWRTASELNNQGYYVQRSADARNWKDLGFQSGAGTTTEEQLYTYTDDNPMPTLNYYRLRQTDFDGRSEYSPIVIADAGFANKAMTLFPNPAPEGVTSLYFPEAPEGEAMLEVFDWLGNKVHRQAIALDGGSQLLVPVDLNSFPAGMYTVTLGVNGYLFSEKLVLKQ